MSLLGIIGPSSQPPPKSGGQSRTEPSATPGGDTGTGASGAPASGGSGSAAPAEQTQAPPAARQVPPPSAARSANVSSAPRPGADGQDATVAARDARSDRARIEAAFASDADEARARRYAEAAQDRLFAQEILSRIPVPVEALPRLTREAERTTASLAPQAPRQARSA